MEHRVRVLPPEVLMEQLLGLLDSAEYVPLNISGSSMTPFLVHSRDTVYLSKVTRPPKKGDMILYRRDNGAYILHRIYRVTPDGYWLVGDAQILIEKGVRYSFYFHYMPVGNGASPDLLPTPEQRKYMIKRVREVRAIHGGKPIFLMDFQNDGEYVGGCIAGGRNYFHINSNGDAEPCVFIHYSNMNIREHSILEILRSPLFMAYHEGQPFNENHLRPCPMLENPELLQEMVARSGAHSTDLESPETAEHLCSKCAEYAACWQKDADEIWASQTHKTPAYTNYKKD